MRGFTLIEMLVVLAVLGVALGVVLYRGAWHSDTVEVRAAADAIADGLRITRAVAFQTDQAASITIDAARHVVIAPHSAPVRLARHVKVAFSGRITFEPNGSSAGAAIRLSEGKSMRRVEVDWLSGRVAVSAR